MVSIQALLFVCILLLVGCTSDREVVPYVPVAQGGTGGIPASLPFDDGDLFDPGILDDAPCCVTTKPFKRLSLFTDTDEPCPDGTVEGDTLYADFLPPAPHTCACSCSASGCVLPDGMHTMQGHIRT
jgi:hypothetical protein